MKHNNLALLIGALTLAVPAIANGPMNSPVQQCRFEPGGGKDYAQRKHPLTGETHWHTGVDLSAPSGTAYLAPADGIITKAGKINDRCGYIIEIKHAENLYSHSCHMKANGFPADIAPGVRVRQGQKVAEVGNTGGSKGPHSHFVVKSGPDFNSHVDPYLYVTSFCGVSRTAARSSGASGQSTGGGTRQ